MPPSKQIDKVGLFLSTEPKKFSYKGLCKVDINLGPKVLSIKQNDKDKTSIEIPFYYPFIMHKNILCHVSPTKLHDIVMIFPTKTSCKDVYNILLKYQVKVKQEVVEDSNIFGELKDRILIPLSNEATDNLNVNESTRGCIMQMIKPFNSGQDVKNVMIKSELSEPPTEVPVEAISSPIVLQMPLEDVEILSSYSRKRKSQTKNSDATLNITSANKKCKTEPPDEVTTSEAVRSNDILSKRFLNSTEFEVQTWYRKSIKKQKLLVYCSADKKFCYSYSFETKGKRFVCDNCKDKNRYVVAHLRNGQGGEQFVELGLLHHICEPLPYTPPSQTFDLLCDIGPVTPNINSLIFTLPSASTATSSNPTSEVSTTLHEPLNTNNDLSNNLMDIKREITEVSEGVSADNEPVTIDSNTGGQKLKALRPPDYEIQKFPKAGEFKQRLIVFYPENRNYCFSYSFEACNNRFACVRCRRNKRTVIAYLRHDSNGDEYIELGPLYHLCPPLYYNLYSAVENDLEESPYSPSNDLSPDEMSKINSDNSSSNLSIAESSTEASIHRKNKSSSNQNEPSSSKTRVKFDEESEISSGTNIVKSPNFEIQMINKNGKRKPQLLVFPYSDKHLCYYYYYDVTNDYFICGKCRKRLHYIIARLLKDNNGENYVSLDEKPHICLPFPYKNADETADSSGINVYLIEEYKRLRKELKISSKIGKEKCVDPVVTENLKSQLSESIPNDIDASEVEDHVTSNESDSDEDYTENEEEEDDSEERNIKKRLDSSEFECQTFIKRGKEKLKLITFVSLNKKYCYIYYHDVYNNRFVCSKCRKQQHNVYAYLRDGPDDDKYVELGLRGHICEPVSYTPPVLEQLFLNPDEYVLTYTRDGRLRPIIFASKDKKRCYEFSPNQKGIYICCGCKNQTGAASINVIEENNLYKISLRNALHICEPREYMPHKNQENVLMSGKFKFYHEKDAPDGLKLVTFPYDNDAEKCRIYEYSHDDKWFRCISCQNVDVEVIAKLFINIFGEEYIIDGAPAEHLCDPIAFLSLDQSIMEFTAKSGLDVKKLKTKTWNESSILKAGNFEIQRNRYGTLNAILIIFVPENKSLCYRYYFDSYTKHYICNNCREKFKIKVTAKLYDDGEDGQKYLKLGSLEHRCKPIEYKAERKIIKKPDYIVFDPSNIIVFPSSNREECYHYSAKKLYCNPCRRMNKEVKVLLFNDENGEECLKLGKNEHVCEPQKIQNVAVRMGVEIEEILAKIEV
uniref:Uncharacterized protein n=1 Tax=Panagrolaimus sp. PS1159 TaxID=55785 RepID=A0AC35GH13_9BILA